MVNLPVYSDNPLINRFLELTTTLLINPVGTNFNDRNTESVQSARAGLQQPGKEYDELGDGIYTFMTCHDKKGDIMIFLMKAKTIFEFGTKHIQMLHRARKILGISAPDPLNIWYTGEILKTASGIEYNFMSGTFSMQRYTGTQDKLAEAKALVETILTRLGHTTVEYTPSVLLTSDTLPLDSSDLKFFKANHIGVYEFEDENNCDQFNDAVQQRMNPHKKHKKLELTGHETREEITRMFHEYQDKLQDDEDFKKILQTYNGTIYTSDKKCIGIGIDILRTCMSGTKWLIELYEKFKYSIMPWRDIGRRVGVGGRRTNKMKMRKFRPRTRRNRTRRYGGRK